MRSRAHPVRRAASDDDGQVMVLTLGFVVVALLLVAVVGSVAAAHLERKRVLALADLVALDAADALTEQAYFERGLGADGGIDGLPLSDAAVRSAVEDYLERHPEQWSGWRSLRVRDASSPDGRSARVEFVVVTNPGPGGWLLSWWGEGVELRAESVARAS
ncbi:pilus assembly protein TadG-related protein [Cellulomonas massiliensis]|uniref:pilus assembly protein TadG-related protein n=1 Tax=Cellulomonas massiliensis TaxID=1465811 RepID=UPI0002DB44F3|nr:hypothetical protein [Cellulomonas massiliensis]